MISEKRYVLLVDDEQNILSALNRELRDWAATKNLEIIMALSAPLALKILGEKAKDTVIVLSDLKMPEMKGSDFLLAIRKMYPDIISILLTGFSEAAEVMKAVEAGISVLLKPWDSAHLLSEVEKAFEQGEMRRQNAYYLKVMEEELRWAGAMQKALLRPTLPEVDGVTFLSSYKPVSSLYCGGDYYDVISLSDDRFLILLGDVAGHGVSAALVTGMLKAIIYPEYVRSAYHKAFSPGHFLSWLNDRINFELRQTTGLFVTFFAGVLDLRQRSFRYANAGQSHPVLNQAGNVSTLALSGPTLGVMETAAYDEDVLFVDGDEALTFYTDGLLEIEPKRMKPPINALELFGAVIYGQDYHERLMEAALRLSGSRTFTDDVTLLTAVVSLA